MANEAPTVITSKKSAVDKPQSLKTDTPSKDSRMAGQCKAPGCMSTSLRHSTSGEDYICPVHAAE